MPSWKKIIQSGSTAELSQMTASDGIRIPTGQIYDNVDGGDTKIIIGNTNSDNGIDKGAGIYFEHAYNGDSSDMRNAGRIVSKKSSLYAINQGTILNNLDFYTAGQQEGDLLRLRITGGPSVASTRVGIGTGDNDLPPQALTVEGNISASGIIYASQFLSSSVAGNLPVSGYISASGYVSASDVIAATSMTLNGDRITSWPSGGGGGSGIFKPTGSKQATTNTVEISGSLKVSGSSTFTNIGTFKQTGNTTMSGSVTLVPKQGEVFTFRAGDFVQIKKPISGIKEVQISGSLRVSGSNSFKVEGPTQLTGSFAITKPDNSGNDLIIDDTGFIYSGSKMRVTGSIATKGGGSFSSTLTTAGVSNTGTIHSSGNITTDLAVQGATSSFEITHADKFLPRSSLADIGKFNARIRKLYMASEIDTSGSLVVNFHSGSSGGLIISASEVSSSDSVFQVNIENNTDGLTKDALYVSSSGNVRVGIGMEQPDQDFSNAGNTRLGTFGNESSLHIPSDMAWWVEDAEGSQLHTGLFEQDPQYSPTPTTMSVVTSDSSTGNSEYSSQVWIPWTSHSMEGQMPLTTTWQVDSQFDDSSTYSVVSGSLLTGSGDGTYPHEVLIFSASDTFENDGQFGYYKEYNDLAGVYNYSFYTWYNSDGTSGVPVLPTAVSESLRSGLYKYKVKLQKTAGSGPNYIEATSSQAFPIDLWWINSNNQYDTGSQTNMTGDTNGDGAVNIMDIVQVCNHILDSSTLTGSGLEAADWNHDGAINVTDAVGMIDYVLQSEATAYSYSTSDENNFVQESNIAYFNAITQMSASINNPALSTTQKLQSALSEAQKFIKTGYTTVDIKHPHMTMFKRDTTNDKIIYPMETQKGNKFNSLNGVLEGSTLVINNTPYIVEEVNSSSPVTSVTLDSGLPPQTISGSSFRHYRPRGLYSPQREGTYDGKITSKGMVVRSDNRVGIGTSSPKALLHISSSKSGSRGTADDLMKITNKDDVNVFKVSKDSEVLIRNATNSSKSASLKVDSSDNLLINNVMKVNHKEIIFKSGSTEVKSTVDPSSGQIKFTKADGTYFAMKGSEVELKDSSGNIKTEVFEDGKKFTRSGSSTTNQIEMQQNSAGAFITVSGSTPGYNIIKTGESNEYRLIRQASDMMYKGGSIFTTGVDANDNMWFINPSISKNQSNTISSLRVSASGDTYIRGAASIGGGLIVSGTIEANSLNVTHLTSSFITASTIQTSGSNIFGDASNDTHKFIGHITASGHISASGHITGRGLEVYGTTKIVDDNVLITTGQTPLSLTSAVTIVGDLKTTSHITASGNISSSGTLISNALTLSGLSNQGTEKTVVTINTSNVVGRRELGNDAFTNDSLQAASTPTDTFFVISDDGRAVVDSVMNQSSSKIGIGNAAPPEKLTVEGNISSSGQLVAASADFKDGNITNVGIIDVDTIRGDSNTDSKFTIGTNGYIFNEGENDLDFIYYDSEETDLIRGDAALSRVKIGGTSPTSKLHIDGDLKTNSHITASGNISASGTIISNIMTPTTITNVSTTHITASNNISSSGTVYGYDIVANNVLNAPTVLVSSAIQTPKISVTNELTSSGEIKLSNTYGDTSGSMHITYNQISMSANVSGSDTLGISGNTTVDGNISSSGGIIVGTKGVTTANTGYFSSSQYDLGGYYNGNIGFSDNELWRFSSSAQSNQGQASNLEMYMNGVRVNKLTTEIGGTSFFGAPTNLQKFGFNAGTAPQDVGITVGGQISASGNLEIDGNATIDGVLTATRKSFLIPHPTKEDKKLQYASLEGPENGVYIRGKLKGDNIIELPDYWSELIDEETISVSLTSIGRFQYLYVKDINSKEIMVGIDKKTKRKIYCHYVIYAERKDIDKLEVEI